MEVDHVASDAMLAEQADHGGHATDRGGVRTEMINDEWTHAHRRRSGVALAGSVVAGHTIGRERVSMLGALSTATTISATT